MPPRPRLNKQRAEAAPAWSMVFQSGYDFFGEMAQIGVYTDEYGRPDRTEVEEAWNLYGDSFLANRAYLPAAERELIPWALEQFGQPRGRRRHAR